MVIIKLSFEAAGRSRIKFKSVNYLEFNSAVLGTNRMRRRVGGRIQWRLVSLQTNIKEKEEGGGGVDLRVYPPMTAGRRDSLKEAEVRVGLRRV